MGARGPAPASAELRLLKGDGTGKDVAGRKVRRQPKAVTAVPLKPDDLGEHGSRMWDQVTPELERLDLIGRLDVGALEMYCRLYEAVRVHDGGRGYASLANAFLAAGSKLGLDPAARLRMTLPEESDDEEGRVFGQG